MALSIWLNHFLGQKFIISLRWCFGKLKIPKNYSEINWPLRVVVGFALNPRAQNATSKWYLPDIFLVKNYSATEDNPGLKSNFFTNSHIQNLKPSTFPTENFAPGVNKLQFLTCLWHLKTKPPFHEFKVLQNIFKSLLKGKSKT